MKGKKDTYQQKSGFKVPDDYFQNLEARLLNVVKEGKTVSENFSKTSGFTVPENYFEKLDDRILSGIETTPETSKVFTLLTKQQLIYAVAIAAVFIGIISTIFLQPIQTGSMESMELSALEDYIDEGYVDFNLTEISSFMYEEGYSPERFTTTNFNSEAVLEYLNENVEHPAYITE